VIADLATGEYLVALWVTRTQQTDAAIHCRDVHGPQARIFGEGLAVCDVGACVTASSWRPGVATRVAAVSGL
jgi:hypothetical protein